MKIIDIQKEILRLKKEKDVYITAHCYQAREIIEVADYTGDSFQLSLAAQRSKNQTIIMCGVRFMAETAKILSPDKCVYLANPDAGCPMADNITKEQVLKAKEKYPGYTVVAYINTTADVKSVCDVCVTSSSGLKIIKNLDNDNIIFLPDPNLGFYLQKMVPRKNFILLPGGCPVHNSVDIDDVKKAKDKYPDALILAHPECTDVVISLADFVGSTTEIMDFAIKSDNYEFLIGTEISIVENLQYICPDKRFYSLSSKFVCPDMKITTLIDVYNCLSGIGGVEINIDESIIEAVKRPIDRMIELGK